MAKKPKKPTKQHCAGCRNDFYNYNNPARPEGPFQCWSLESAELIKARIVHIDDKPPYTRQPIKIVPSCWFGNRLRAIDQKS